MRVVEGEAALANLKANPCAGWPRFDDAANRLWPIARPGTAAGFSIAEGARIFTMGSCFARNIETRLHEMGMEVPTRSLVRTLPNFRAQMLNVYSVASIWNELRWALADEGAYDYETNIVEVLPGGFVDLHLADAAKPAPYEAIKEIRDRVIALNRMVAESDVIILTLGLVESWWDRESEQHLNVTPPKRVVQRSGARFALHVLDYEEILHYLRASFDLLAKRMAPHTRVILTVSPVPLSRTFTDQDVAVANCYSKSVLRAAAEAIVQQYAFVDYFPSYESVTLSDPRLAWDADRVHVTGEVVKANIERLVELYCGGARAAAPAAADADPLAAFASVFEAGQMIKAAALAPALVEAGHDDPRLHFALAWRSSQRREWRACLDRLASLEAAGSLERRRLRLVAESQLELGLPDEAEASIGALAALVRRDNGPLEFLRGRLAALRGDEEEAYRRLHDAVRFSPDNRGFITALADFCEAIGRGGEATNWRRIANPTPHPSDNSPA